VEVDEYEPSPRENIEFLAEFWLLNFALATDSNIGTSHITTVMERIADHLGIDIKHEISGAHLNHIIRTKLKILCQMQIANESLTNKFTAHLTLMTDETSNKKRIYHHIQIAGTPKDDHNPKQTPTMLTIAYLESAASDVCSFLSWETNWTIYIWCRHSISRL